MRISDWSSDVCSSDLEQHQPGVGHHGAAELQELLLAAGEVAGALAGEGGEAEKGEGIHRALAYLVLAAAHLAPGQPVLPQPLAVLRSEEHTSELQSLMRISYAVFCLKKQKHVSTPSALKLFVAKTPR